MKETKKTNLHVKTGDRVIVISGKDKKSKFIQMARAFMEE